jgi:hypothetical protein
MQKGFESVKGDLADDRVQHVFYFAGQHEAAAFGIGLGFEKRAEG